MATEQDIRELLDKMAEERERLLADARALTDEQASRRPDGKTGEAEWSAKEQLAHLCRRWNATTSPGCAGRSPRTKAGPHRRARRAHRHPYRARPRPRPPT
ncbi:MAG: hypothetical protein U0531_04170 [Dehalococcoidia bacterium]